MRRDGKLSCKKRVILKAGIPPSIGKEAVRRVLRKTDQPAIDSFWEKRIPEQKRPEIETYKFAEKACCKRSLQCNYEIGNHQKAYGNRESRS